MKAYGELLWGKGVIQGGDGIIRAGKGIKQYQNKLSKWKVLSK